MGNVAYELRADYAGTVTQDDVEVPLFTGGLIAVGDDRDIDVRALLDEGDGTVVVDEMDTAAVQALDQYPALKRVTADPDAAPILGYSDRKVSDLHSELKGRRVEGAGNLSKADAVAALERHDARQAAGDPVEAGTHVNDLMADEAAPGGETK